MTLQIDGRSPAIKAGPETTGKAQTVVQVQERSLHLHDLVLDPFSRLLFWSCSSTDVINATRIDVPNPRAFIIVRKEMFKPRDLAVHSGLGYAYDDTLGVG